MMHEWEVLTLLGLRNIPLQDIRVRDTDILGQLHGTTTATSKLHSVNIATKSKEKRKSNSQRQ